MRHMLLDQSFLDQVILLIGSPTGINFDAFVKSLNRMIDSSLIVGQCAKLLGLNRILELNYQGSPGHWHHVACSARSTMSQRLHHKVNDSPTIVAS